MAERLFSTYQLADLLGTTPGAVAGWVQKGWLESRSLPDGGVFVSEDGLISFVRDRGMDVDTITTRLAGYKNEIPANAQPSDVEPESTAAKEAEPGRTAPQETSPSPQPQPKTQAAQLAEAILEDAVNRRSSHIHLCCQADELTLQLRIDGVLHDKPGFKRRLPSGLAGSLVDHFKSLAGLDVEAASRLQKGRFIAAIDGADEEFSLAACPVVAGEKIVISPVAPPVVSFAQLGLKKADLMLVRGLLARSGGIILLVGPPRSGKRTTLSTMLSEIDARGRSVISLARRPEMPREGVTHCRLADVGASFTDAVTNLSVMDSDVIATEYIDEASAAKAAVEAALDGSLVIASIVAEDAPDALEMMMESVGPWQLASTLLAVIAQRTVRRLCESCRQPAPVTRELLKEFGLEAQDLGDSIYQPGGGCEKCSRAGYAGTTRLFSVLRTDGELAGLLRRKAEPGDIALAATCEGTITLRQAGLAKVRSGDTSLEQIAALLPRAE